MLRSIAKKFKVSTEKYIPDAFIFAIILTLITYLMGIIIAGKGPFELVGFWYNGFWNFLAFSMQMAVILLTGFALATSPPVQRLIKKVAAMPKGPNSAIVITVLFSAAGAWVNWGFGLVLGSIFAREIAKRVKGVDYPILVAAAYSGFIAGLPASLSITAPLLVNTPGHFLEDAVGLIPLQATIFSPVLLGTAIVTTILVAWAYRNMIPTKKEEIRALDVSTIEESAPALEPAVGEITMANKLENSAILNYIIVAGGFSWIIYHFATNGFDLNLNFVNFFFLFLGLALHKTPKSYISAFQKGAGAAGPIILQFPFYAGIQGIMASSGLIVIISGWFVSISTATTLPFWSYVSACIVNFFVPSAGGQWIVQGPIMVEAAKTLSVAPSAMVNSVTLGDVTTNLIQPFWALPALGIAKLGIKDIWGYCLVAMIIMFIVGSAFVLIF